ncbi:hypothetical protein M3181_21960 [Mesobacillus maritimus]|uniref:hypothetical protein n=1 Tax=Mesobacillus maritimus TaxID=1643336 RepID=UPI00203C14A2|nr:hypothetical protein [Mesobacillus maritimus]MCM3671625.1 hypothetical protein [Mesobacillus maritimus]
MLLIKKRALEDKSIYINEFVDFDSKWLDRARKEFEDCRQNGIILNSSFDDCTWILTNEHKYTRLNFVFPQTLFQEQISKKRRSLSMSFEEFNNAVKAFIIFKIHYNTQNKLKALLLFLIKVVENTDYFHPKKASDWLDGYRKKERDSSMRQINDFLGFIDFLPISDIHVMKVQAQEDFESMKESYYMVQKGNSLNRRQLGEFQSYFYFDKLFKQFWFHIATESEKLYYYPLFLWWELTNILPLRPTEFTLIPYNCLIPNSEGGYKLTIRRTTLKGINKKFVFHKIDEDYELFDYPIPFHIANYIKDYQEKTKKFGDSVFLMNYECFLSFLPPFSQLTLKAKRGQLLAPFSISTLDTILMHFYKDILQGKFNLEIVSKESNKENRLLTNELKDNEEEHFIKPTQIMKINLGDTRHFALINMALSDVNPILIKDFTGHSDINMSYHYFGHIDKIVKCISYNKFKELRQTIIDEGKISTLRPVTLNSIKSILNKDNERYRVVDLGKCFSPKFYEGDITHCVEADNGDCFNCKFIELSDKESKEILENRKMVLEKEIKDDGIYFFNMITKYKGYLNEEAELNRSFLKLQQSTNEYLNLEQK